MLCDTSCKLPYFMQASLLHALHSQGTIQAQKPIISLKHHEVMHVAKVCKHIANTLLVFLALYRMGI